MWVEIHESFTVEPRFADTPGKGDIRGNVDTVHNPEHILHILHYLWNKHNPLIRTLWVGPKSVSIRGVQLYSQNALV